MPFVEIQPYADNDSVVLINIDNILAYQAVPDDSDGPEETRIFLMHPIAVFTGAPVNRLNDKTSLDSFRVKLRAAMDNGS